MKELSCSASSEKDFNAIPELSLDLSEDQYPQYNKELGPTNKYLNLETVNKPKKNKDHVRDTIKRKSVLISPEYFKNQSTLLNSKIADVLAKTNSNKNLVNSTSFSDDESENNVEDTQKQLISRRKTMKSKRGRDLRKALKEALHYIASLKLDLAEV